MSRKRQEKRPVGRPPEGEFSRKLATLSTRITPELRARLEAERDKTGHSLSQVIEFRLRQSFRDDDVTKELTGRTFHEEVTRRRQDRALLRLVAMAIEHVETVTRQRWSADPYTFEQAFVAMATVLRAFRPAGAADRPESVIVKTEHVGAAVGLGLIEAVKLAAPAPLTFWDDRSSSKELRAVDAIKSDLGDLAERIKT